MDDAELVSGFERRRNLRGYAIASGTAPLRAQ